MDDHSSSQTDYTSSSFDDKSSLDDKSSKDDEEDEIAKFGKGLKKFTNKVIKSTKKIPSNFNQWLNS